MTASFSSKGQPLTIDTHHHILPDFFWRETNDSHAELDVE